MNQELTLGRWSRTMPALCVLGAFATTRIALLFFHLHLGTDLKIYLAWIRQAEGGLLPFVDFSIEYPPLAWWVMQLPGTVEKLDYYFRFRLLMGLADVGAFWLLLWIVSRRQAQYLTAFGGLYVATTVILEYVLYDRLDIGVLFLVAVSLAAWLKAESSTRKGGWLAAAYAAAGVGAAYKLFPLVFVPFFVLSEALTGTRSRPILVRMAWCAGIAAAPLAVTYAFGGTKALDFLEYHGARGLEIESTWASTMWLLSRVGGPVNVVVRHGSWELAGYAEATLRQASLMVTLLYFGCFVLWSLALKSRFDASRASTQGLLALGGFVLVSKVFSTQYLLWSIPALAIVTVNVVRAPRQAYAIFSLFVVAAALTTVVYPLGVKQIPLLAPWIMSTLLVRNIAYAVAWIWLTRLCLERDLRPSDRPATPLA